MVINHHCSVVTEFPLCASITFTQHEALSRSRFSHDVCVLRVVGDRRRRWHAHEERGGGVPEGGYVSRRLLQLVMPVFPDRRMFRIHDPEVHPDAPGGPLPPIGVLVSASREQLWIGSLQQDIDVRLVLEEWDGQPLLPDAWDEEAKARLYLRGRLSIDMGSAGPAVSGLRLSGGVGNYEVRIYARYRETVVQMYADLFSQHRDPLSDDFQREKRKLEGVERYLVQLWRDS
jgi:hypothetical protein